MSKVFAGSLLSVSEKRATGLAKVTSVGALRRAGVLAATLAVLAVSAGCPMAGPPPDDAAPTIVVEWNREMLAAIRAGAPRPTVVSRSMFIVHAAMYDAWAAYDDKAEPYADDAPSRRFPHFRTESRRREAVAHAAYWALVNQFPAYEAATGAFLARLTAQGYDVADADAPGPARVGFEAAEAVIAERLGDGSNQANNYAEITSSTYPQLYSPVNSADPTTGRAPGGALFDPNRWQPLRTPTGSLLDADGLPTVDPAIPTSFVDQQFLTPHWGAVRPFSLSNAAHFRPAPPPMLGSQAPYVDYLGFKSTSDEAYRMQFDQIRQINASLTDQQKIVAEFWEAGPGTETPPGQWNLFAQGISKRDAHELGDDVKMFFALNGALMDAGISCWETKRFYDSARPVSAIQSLFFDADIAGWGGPNKGTVLLKGRNWRPYQKLTFVTPAFGEYTSGHSSFSSAAAEVLTQFTGRNTFFDGQTVLDVDLNGDNQPDLLGEYVALVGSSRFESQTPRSVVTLRWATLQDAAAEAGMSRLYGGIHIQDANLAGQQVGREVGKQAIAQARRLWEGRKPD